MGTETIYSLFREGVYIVPVWGRRPYTPCLGKETVYSLFGEGVYILPVWGRKLHTPCLGKKTIYSLFREGDYIFPVWANILGWIISLSSILVITPFGLIELYKVGSVTFIILIFNSFLKGESSLEIFI